jgi:hypothetical protein
MVMGLVAGASGAMAPGQAGLPCSSPRPAEAGSSVIVTMKNGETARGVVVSSASGVMQLKSASFGQIAISLCEVSGIEAIPVEAMAVAPLKNSPPVPPPAVAKVRSYGLEAFTISMGFTGSASRDESYSAAPTFYALETKARARTLLNLSASYDDKWKATPLSSNVTQVYSGRLQQLFNTGANSAVFVSASAYRNNSQGIIVDQAYAVGAAKTISYPKGKNSYLESDLDLRAIRDEMKAPGPTVLLAGSNLSLSYSRRFDGPASPPGVAARQPTSLVFKAGAVPVFNRANSWQAYGTFDCFHPVTKSWSVGLQAVDNYFEIAPKGYNKNYLKMGLSIKYALPANPGGK